MRCFVSGRVQGVWYRATTADRARELGLRGWARNLDDGRVEVVAAGEPGAVATLCGWLWTGSPGSQVVGVTVEDFDEPVAAGFDTR